MSEPERVWPLTDSELERALHDLGAHLAYPDTPDLAGRVGTRLRAQPVPARRLLRPPAWTPRWRLALAALVVLALAGTFLVASPRAREAVADLLGLRGVEIQRGGTGPTLPATTAPEDHRPNLGERMTLAEARRRVGFRLLVPTLAGLGQPDEVYLDPTLPGGEVSLVYLQRPGWPRSPFSNVAVILSQFQADVSDEPEVTKKILGEGARLELVTVNGGRGYWISGAPHEIYYRDVNGDLQRGRSRIKGNTLLWEQGRLTLRLEAQVAKEQALRLAGSVR